MVGLLAIPWGRTVHSYRKAGPELLMGGTENAKRSQSRGWRGMEKKQSFMSIASRGTLAGMAEIWGSPLCGEPQIRMVLLIALKSCNSLHPPERFFIANTGVFHGLREGRMCRRDSCSSTSSLRALSFSLDRGHCGTQTASSESQSRQGVLNLTVAPRIGGDLEGGYLSLLGYYFLHK